MTMPAARFGSDRRKDRRLRRRGIIGRDLGTGRYISRKRYSSTVSLEIGTYRTIRIFDYRSLDVEVSR